MHVSLLSSLALLGLTSLVANSAPTAPAPKLCEPQEWYDGAMNAVFTANKDHYPYIRAAAREFDMCDRKRFSAFVGQIAHETGRLTTLHQPKDEGAGALHMLPNNWKFAFQFLAKAHPDLVKDLGGDYNRKDAVASKIMQQREVAYIVAGWWFDSGASYVLNNKCTGMSGLADKLSGTGKWAPEDDDIMNLIGSCVFGMDFDEGAPQRREFIKAAFAAFIPPKTITTTTTTSMTTTAPITTTTTTDTTTAKTSTSTSVPTTSTTDSSTATSTTTTSATATTTSTQSHGDDKTTTTAATATSTSSAVVPPAEPTHGYGKRPTKPGKPVVEPVDGKDPIKPVDPQEPVYGKRPEPKKEEGGDKKGEDKKPIQAPAKCY